MCIYEYADHIDMIYQTSPVLRVTLYTAGHLHTAVPHCWHSRAPIVHTAMPRENNEHGCVYLRCRAVCKLPGCVEGHPWSVTVTEVYMCHEIYKILCDLVRLPTLIIQLSMFCTPLQFRLYSNMFETCDFISLFPISPISSRTQLYFARHFPATKPVIDLRMRYKCLTLVIRDTLFNNKYKIMHVYIMGYAVRRLSSGQCQWFR